MIVTTTITLPDGRAYELSLEPLFDRHGNLRDVKCQAFRDVKAEEPQHQQQTELVTSEGTFWFDRL
jgi:hypothetical protein